MVIGHSPHPRPPPPELLTPGVLVPTFILLIAVGYFLFARGIGTPAGNELSRHQALMTAVNAATLTGFQQARNPRDYTPAGQVITLGLMAVGTLFSLVGGGLAVVRIARLPYRDGPVAGTAVVALVAVAVIGAVTLGGDRTSAFDGAFQAVSAFGNCGLFTGRLPRGDGPQAMLVLLPLAVLGSLGLPVLIDLAGWAIRPWRRSPSSHAQTVLAWTAGVYLLAAVLLAPLLLAGGGNRASVWALAGQASSGPARQQAVEAAVRDSVMTASREAVNARSAGFPFAFLTDLPPAATVVVLAAMVVGGAPGGTAGGAKVTTLAVVAGGVGAALRGRPTGRAFGLAVGWLLIYVVAVAVATVALLIADPDVRPDRVLFLAASGLGNVGLSHDPVVPSTAGMYVLSATMLAGRIGPVLVLWTLADQVPDVTEAMG